MSLTTIIYNTTTGKIRMAGSIPLPKFDAQFGEAWITTETPIGNPSEWQVNVETKLPVFVGSDRYPAPVLSPTATQMRMALEQASLYEQTKSIVAGHYMERMRIWFEYATVWERGNPYVQALQVELGLDDAQMDSLFAAALLL